MQLQVFQDCLLVLLSDCASGNVMVSHVSQLRLPQGKSLPFTAQEKSEILASLHTLHMFTGQIELRVFSDSSQSMQAILLSFSCKERRSQLVPVNVFSD